jgi:anti-sigma B factor antagonist
MPGIGYRVEVISGVPVVVVPAEVDATTAAQLRTALLGAAADGRMTVVVDMTRTRFCDSAGLDVLVRAHRRALADGGELRLVIPADGTVVRILTLTGMDRLIPSFGSVEEALV